jgi:hypothetical protein
VLLKHQFDNNITGNGNILSSTSSYTLSVEEFSQFEGKFGTSIETLLSGNGN